MATPKVIHQIWKQGEVPDEFRAFVASIRANHPDYEYRLWTDVELDALVAAHAPDQVGTYKSFKKSVEQVDFARYLILYVIGGAYFDLDVVSIRSIDPLVESGQIVLGLECSEHTRQFWPRPSRIVCNALMISPPGEPLWRDLMQHIVDHYGKWRWWWHRGPVYRTGPLALTAVVDGLSAEAARRVTVLPSCAFFPMSDHWNDGHVVGGYDSISNDCESFDETYAVHLWSHSWLPRSVQWFNQHKRYVLAAGALALAGLIYAGVRTVSHLK
jgi:mannosyltransferase OCH1-like enzyme